MSLYRFRLNALVSVRCSCLFVPCHGGLFQIPRCGVGVCVGVLYRLRVGVRLGLRWYRLRVGVGVLVPFACRMMLYRLRLGLEVHVTLARCMLLCCLRAEVGSTRLRVCGGVGIHLYRACVGVDVFVPFEVEWPCTAYVLNA